MPVDMTHVNAFKAALVARYGEKTATKIEMISRYMARKHYERDGGEWIATQDGQPTKLLWHRVFQDKIQPLLEAAKDLKIGLEFTLIPGPPAIDDRPAVEAAAG